MPTNKIVAKIMLKWKNNPSSILIEVLGLGYKIVVMLILGRHIFKKIIIVTQFSLKNSYLPSPFVLFWPK